MTNLNHPPHKSTTLEHVIMHVRADKSCIWNFIEIFQQYISYFGFTLTRANLVNQLCIHFDKELLLLTSPGIASILAFRVNTLNIVKENGGYDLGGCVDTVGTQIRQECKAIIHDMSLE